MDFERKINGDYVFSGKKKKLSDEEVISIKSAITVFEEEYEFE